MRRDPTEWRERVRLWKETGELQYEAGKKKELPKYEDGKESGLGKVPGIGFVRQRLYNNVMPMGYDNPAKRMFNGLVLNKKEDTTPEDFSQPSDSYKVLDNLWAQYLHIPEKSRKTKDPKYGLIKNQDDTYSLKYPKVLYHDIKLANLPKIDRDNINTDVKLNQNTNVNQNFVLGNFQVQRKIDPYIGEFVEYSDTWDINPYQNTDNLYGQQEYKDRNIFDKMFTKILPKGGDASFGIGTPIKIKGRIPLEDIYGAPRMSTAPQKGDYYGGWLPEIVIRPTQ